MQIIIDIPSEWIGKIGEIASRGLASEGHTQTDRFVIHCAIEEFIKKYWKKEAER